MNISIIDFFQEFFYSEIKTKILEIKNDKMIMNYWTFKTLKSI